MMPTDWLSVLGSYSVFGALGYGIGGALRRPVSSPVLIGTVVLALVAGYVGVHTKLICTSSGFTVYLNWALQALALGMLCSLLLRRKAPSRRDERRYS